MIVVMIAAPASLLGELIASAADLRLSLCRLPERLTASAGWQKWEFGRRYRSPLLLLVAIAVVYVSEGPAAFPSVHAEALISRPYGDTTTCEDQACGRYPVCLRFLDPCSASDGGAIPASPMLSESSSRTSRRAARSV